MSESQGYFGYGVLHRSESFEQWENSLGTPYAVYRRQWGERVKSRDPGTVPLSLNLELTTRCNLACSFCSNPTLRKDQIKDLDESVIDSIISSINKFSIPAANMNGLGESFLRNDFPQLATRLKSAGIIDLMVHTNVTIMNPELAEKLVLSGLDRIIFSVDSPVKKTYEQLRLRRNLDSINISTLSKEEYYNESTDLAPKGSLWEETIASVLIFRAVRDLIGKKTPLIRATMILLDDTQDQVDYYLAFWKGIADQITLQDLAWQQKLLRDDQTWQNKQNHSVSDPVDELIDKYKQSEYQFSCPALYQASWILSDGNVTPCSNPNAREHMVMGSLCNSSIEDIWHNENYTKLRTLHDQGLWYLHPHCRTCEKAHVEVTNMLSSNNAKTASHHQDLTRATLPSSTDNL